MLEVSVVCVLISCNEQRNSRVYLDSNVVSCSAPPGLRLGKASVKSLVYVEEKGERQTFLGGMNRDAAGLGRGGGLSFFFGRGSWGDADTPSELFIGCPLAWGGGFSVLVCDVVGVVVPFVPCSNNELVETVRFIGGFIPSLGLISSGSWGSVAFRGSGETGAALGLATGVGRTRFDGDVKYATVACTSLTTFSPYEILRLTSTSRWRERASPTIWRQFSSLLSKVGTFPRTNREDLARVRATFIRLVSGYIF